MKQGRSTGKPTKAQEARFHAIYEIGCIVCRKMRRGWVPCHVHHLTIGGKHGQKRRGHDYTIGLCPWHHVGVLGDATKDGPSYAKQARAFRERYGDDDVLLEQQNSAIERIKQSNPWRNTHAPIAPEGAMSSSGGWPEMAGKLGRSTPAQIADVVVQRCPARNVIAVLVDSDGGVWMDMPDAADEGDLVGVYRRTSDPDALAEDLECAAKERGI